MKTDIPRLVDRWIRTGKRFKGCSIVTPTLSPCAVGFLMRKTLGTDNLRYSLKKRHKTCIHDNSYLHFYKHLSCFLSFSLYNTTIFLCPERIEFLYNLDNPITPLLHEYGHIFTARRWSYSRRINGLSRYVQRVWGPFLQSPGNLPGPISIFLNVFRRDYRHGTSPLFS